MYYRSINYYGYDKNRYDDCKDLINEANFRHLRILNTWLLGLTVVFLFLSKMNLFGVTGRSFNMYLSFFVLSLIPEVLLFAFKDFTRKHSGIFLHLNAATMVTFGIYSSIKQPYLTATMYLVLLVLLAVTYIGTMVSVSVIMILYSALFLYTSYKYKSHSLFELDSYNVTVFLILAIVLHYTFQHTKMEQFTTLQRNIQIQRDLEIRSSFDTLTDLLNRARFFSIAGEIVGKYTQIDEYIAIALLDLDKFKQINDTLGHQMGDKAIQTTATIIAEELNLDLLEKWSFANKVVKERISFAGRLGGDEYILFIRGLKNDEEAIALLNRILDRLKAVKIGELKGIRGSFGVTALKESDEDIDTAYQRADAALYTSKSSDTEKVTFNK